MTTYEHMAKAIEYCREHRLSQPTLADMAAAAGMSPTHFQRTFTQWAGVSPARYLQFLTKESALQRLQKSTLLDTALDCGLSGTARLHDLLLAWEGVTPGDVRRAGDGLSLYYGDFDSPLGRYLLVVAPRGICRLAFYDDDVARQRVLDSVRNDWPLALIKPDQQHTAGLASRVFPTASTRDTLAPLSLWLKGSPFQRQVWQALLRVPEGQLCSYQQLASAMGKPRAVRAVASAVARNPIGYLIPCHRVIRSSGEWGEYRWGAERKRCLIGWEAARTT